MNGEAGPKAGLTAAGSTVRIPVDAGKVARWLEMAEFAIDNGPERVDTLLELADSLETVWLALCELERAA